MSEPPEIYRLTFRRLPDMPHLMQRYKIVGQSEDKGIDLLAEGSWEAVHAALGAHVERMKYVRLS